MAGPDSATSAAGVETPVFEQIEKTVAQRWRDCGSVDTTSAYSQLACGQ